MVFVYKQFHIFSVSYVYYVLICAFFVYFFYFLLPYLCVTLHLLRKLVKLLCVSACVSSFFHLSASICLPFVQLHWQISLWQDKPCAFCYQHNHNLIILVKLLQMIWDYIASFKMCQASCHSFYLCIWKICILNEDDVVISMPHFSSFTCSR